MRKILERSLVTVFALATVLTLALPAQAQTELPQPGGFAGLLLGYAKPGDLDGSLGYGAEIGLAFTNGLTGFGYFMGSEPEEAGVKATYSHYGLGAEYRFDQWINGLRAGARLGMASVDVGGASDSAFSFGPHIGWDYRVAPNLSVGVEPVIMFDMFDDSDTTLYVFGTGRFWF